MVNVLVGKKAVDVACQPSDTIRSLREKVAKAAGLDVNRVSLALKSDVDAKKARVKDHKPTRFDDNKRVSDYPQADKEQIVLKDLGPQIGYRTVFVVEYLGPIIIMLLYASRPAFLYGEKAAAQTWNPIAFAGLIAWTLHFVKRELETFFVHKFSRPTMPLMNLFKNSVYYWGFALGVGYPLCHPEYTAPVDMNQVYVGGALMLIAELVNLAVHLQLSNMRPQEGSTKRDAPGGPLFALVSCPNYTAEVLSWVGFSIMTQIGLSYVFTLVGLAQMSEWAIAKHKGYLKSDPTYKQRGRKAIIPFLL